eukprot:CAMPEP_0175643844 /NCGR_PEP_ID=MMETSP0097-20121207/6004_1 /TAXON_ID=311494 /ORGANISM="Alexandrium monilatum, Strain CCMP3105" /LENGTH=304 /DNA_ID=CAMNT_0016949701 /DNA_START=44 /DNA_END=955 /DNA_ORIENTATION=-
MIKLEVVPYEMSQAPTPPSPGIEGTVVRVFDLCADADSVNETSSWDADSESSASEADSDVIVRLGPSRKPQQLTLSTLLSVPRADGRVMSLGSARHPEECVACKFHSTARGCFEGPLCSDCHFPHSELTYSMRRKLCRRRDRLRARALLLAPGGPGARGAGAEGAAPAGRGVISEDGGMLGSSYGSAEATISPPKLQQEGSPSQQQHGFQHVPGARGAPHTGKGEERQQEGHGRGSPCQGMQQTTSLCAITSTASTASTGGAANETSPRSLGTDCQFDAERQVAEPARLTRSDGGQLYLDFGFR